MERHSRRAGTVALVFAMATAVLAAPPNVPQARAAFWNVPVDFPTIAAAIADSGVLDGDTITVNAGSFTQNLVFDKNLTVVAEFGTVHIDVGGSGASAVTVDPGKTVTLNGLTIQGGANVQGGGINNHGTLDLILSQVFGNAASSVGGGIYSDGALTIDRSYIYSNESAGSAGGIFVGGGTLDVINTAILGNYTTFTGGAGGLEVADGVATLTNTSVIYNNSYGDGGGVSGGGGSLTIRNTVIAQNSVATFAGFFDNDCTGTITSAGHNLIGEVTGGCTFAPAGGDLTGSSTLPLDPRFGVTIPIDYPLDDVQILSDSPLIDAGDNTGLDGLTDISDSTPRTVDGTADGTDTVDIGAFEFDPITVCPGVAVCDHETLDAALAAVPIDGAIRLAPGDYTNLALTFSDNVTIQGSGTAVTLLSGSSDTNPLTPRDTTNRPITINDSANVSLNDLTVMSGEPIGDVPGGGIYVTGGSTYLEAIRVRVTDNLAGDAGGGVAVGVGASAALYESTIDNNVGEEGGGGINAENGIYIEDSTITNNATLLGSGGGVLFAGGGGSDIVTSTITGNSANGAFAEGGGVAITGGGVFMNHVTLWDNYAELAGDGLSSFPGGVGLFNTILAEPPGDDLCEGEIDVSGFSIVSNTDDCTVNDFGGVGAPNILGTTGSEIDPLLDSLADNGGPTQTLALLVGSPAIDTASDAPPASEGSCGGGDQRGFEKPLGLSCDIGAYEGFIDPFVIQDAIDAATAGDTINIPAGLYSENLTVGIDLNFVGVGVGATSVNGGGLGCVFEIQNGADVSFTDMSISGGDCPTGGGINMTTLGTLDITRVAFSGNNASSGGGGAVAASGDVTITNGTFVGNTAPAGTGGALWAFGPLADIGITNSSFSSNSSDGSGGAVHADNDNGSVTISGTSFSANSISGVGAGGGAIYLDGPPSDVSASFVANQAPNGFGGAIWVRSAILTMNVAGFTNNSASAGGAIFGSEGPIIDIATGTFSGNTATTSGGAINTVGTSVQIFLSDTDLELNSAPTGGGAIVMDAGNLTIDTGSTFIDNAAGVGGAIRFTGDGALTIDTATFNLNSADFGGAIFVGPTASATRTVDIDNATFEDNNADEGGALNVDAATFTIDESSFDNNDANNGGAIYVPGGSTTLTIGTGTTLSGNDALGGWGGAIFGDAGTLINVVDSTVGPSNTAVNLGGGIYSFADVTLTRTTLVDNAAFQGAGAFVHGNLTMTDSTIAGNDASDDAGGVSAVNLDMRNSTVSGNTATGDGGGIYLFAGGTVAINSSTIVDNDALGGGGGIFKATEIPAAGVLSNTIIANNTAGSPTLGHDCSLGAGSGFIDGGFNLVSRSDVANPGENPASVCGLNEGGGNILGFYDPGFEVDPLLAVLADNGGSTQTHALLPGSPAIDMGNTFGVPQCESTSQNGLVRPQGSECDIGAFELDVAGLPALVVDVSTLNPVIEPGLTSIPVGEIGANALADATGRSASEVASNQEVSAIKESPIANIPIANIPIANIFIDDAPINSIAAALLGDLLLIDVPVTGGWPSLLGPNLRGPIQQYTLADAFDDPSTAANIAAAGLSFNDLGLASTPIASISPVALALGSTPIANIPIDGLTDPVLALQEWCSRLAGTPASCAVLGITPSDPTTAEEVTLFSLALAEAPIANIPIANIPIANIPIANIPIANIPIANIPIANIPIANIPIANIPIANIPIANIALGATPIANIPIANIPIANIDLLLDCSSVDCAAIHAAGTLIGAIPIGAWIGSFGELLKLLVDAGELDGALVSELLPGLPADALIGDLIAFLLPPADMPWQDVDLLSIGLTSSANATTNAVTYEAVFTASNIGAADTVEVAMVMPPGIQYIPGSGSFDYAETLVAVDPTVSGNALIFGLVSSSLEGTQVTLSFDATTPLRLGPLEVISSVDVPGVVTDSASLNQFVREAYEPNNTPPTATPIATDTLYVTHIGSKGDRDFFRLSGVQAGSEISIILANLPDDFDVVLYGPEAVTLRGTPERVAAGVRDPDLELLKTGEVQAELVNDLLLENLDIVGVSANRGTADETIETGAVPRSGNYYIQVTGYNGAKSALPYTLRARVEAPGGLGSCAASPIVGGTPGGAPGSLPPNVNTLFLWNHQRFEAVHGTAAANQVEAALNQVAGSSSLGVNGAVIPVEGFAPVGSAYTDWNADPCSVDAANAVANSIAQVVDDYRAANPTIQYVVVVGSDEQIPQFRIYDTTTIANENTYTSSVSGQLNELTAALAGSFYFSDDPYGDAHPVITRTGQEIYVPTVSLGRLVEDDQDILRALDNFRAFNGLLDPATVASAFVSGYDFLSDGAQAVGAGLAASGHDVTPLINDNWNSLDLAAGLLNGTISLASPNAHYDHWRAQPANVGAFGLFENNDVDAAGPSVVQRVAIWTMGCHSGLSVSDVQIGGGSLVSDWAQTYAGQGAGAYIGNSGFGYGETETVALSELLMQYYAENLNGLMTSGQAFQFAKHRYAAGELLYGSYDQKSLMEATYFGLPMFRIGGGGVPPATPPVIPTFSDGQTGLVAGQVDLDLTGDFQLNNRPRGQFYSVGGKQQVTPFRPVQPKVEIDVTQPNGLIAQGAIITGLSSVDMSPFDPVMARPTVDLTANEPEPRLTSIFPTQLQTINRYLDISGYRDQLVIVPGQYRNVNDGLGVQRLFGTVETTIYYAPPGNTDYEPPVVLRSQGFETGGANQVNFRAEIVDDSGVDGVKRVVVLFKNPSQNDWTSIDLTYQGDGVWSGSASTAGGLQDFFIQAVDGAGNVGVTQKKGEYFETAAPSTSSAVTVSGTQTAGWYRSPVIVEVAGDPGVGFGYNLDGEGFTQYATPFPVNGEGMHVIDIVGSDGTDDLVTLQIDDTAPVVLSPIQGAVIAQNSIRPVFYGCTDAGSGVQTCAGPALGTQLDTATVGTFSFDVTTADLVGSSVTTSVSYNVVAPPTAAIQGAPAGLIDEGSTITVTGVTNAAAPLFGWRLFQDGYQVASAMGEQVSFLIPDDGSYEVRLKVFSNGVDSDVAVAAFDAYNVEPSLSVGGVSFGAVGEPYFLGLLEVEDPGADSVFAYFVDWGDGDFEETDVLGTLVHFFAEPGTYELYVEVEDEDGSWFGAAFDVEVGVGPPTITVDEVSTFALEGEQAFNAGTYGGLEVVDVSATVGEVDFGDGIWTWIYGTFDGPDDSTTVFVTVEDINGNTAEVEFELQVENVDPFAALSGNASALVGADYLLGIGSVVDPGDDTVVGWTVDWGDSSAPDVFSAPPGSATHSYEAIGEYVIGLTLEDEDGAYDVDFLTVTVDDVPLPTILVEADSVIVLEGQTATNSGSYTGTGPADVSTDLGDVTFGAGSWNWSFDSTDGPDESQTVTVTVEDDFGIAEVTFELGVDNVDPVADISGDPNALVGVSYSASVGPIVDPGDDTVIEWVVDWGDSSPPDVLVAEPGSVSHVYASPDVYDVTLTVTDEDGTFEVDSFAVAVEDPPPPGITANASAVNVAEGAIATNAGSYSGTGSIEITADLGVVTAGGGTWSWSFIAGDGPDDSQTATVMITDDYGSAQVSFDLTVDNVAPTAGLSGATTVAVGAPYSLTVGPAVDPGADTVSDYTVNWGDGTPADVLGGPGPAGHTYTAIGSYQITLDLVDEDGTYLAVASLTVEVAAGGPTCETAVATITGTSGNDVIFGTDGDDVIFSLGGNDLIFGRNGNDIICTAGGNDIVYAGSGDDYVDGGAGNDALHGNHGDDIVLGGDGNDNLFGGVGADELFGGDGNDNLFGWVGNDILAGGNGNDSLFGEWDDDLLIGGPGNDALWGAFGNDTISYADSVNAVRLNLSNTWITGEGTDRAYFVENAVGSEFADLIIGTNWANRLEGLGGADDIRAKGGNDDVFGGAGDDTLRGQGGNDLIDGGADLDWRPGGPGAEVCINGETVISCIQ